MMNATQIPTLISSPPAPIPDQFRLATRLINQGKAIDEMRTAGYEIVTLPSGYYEAAMLSADRVIDSGELTTRDSAPPDGWVRTAIGGLDGPGPDQHRSRIFSTFADLEGPPPNARLFRSWCSRTSWRLTCRSHSTPKPGRSTLAMLPHHVHLLHVPGGRRKQPERTAAR